MKTHLSHYLFAFSNALILFSFFSCTPKQNAEDKPIEYNWGTAALRIERPVAEGAEECYLIDFKLDTLAGESPLAKSLSAVLCDSVIGAGYSSLSKAMQAFADSLEADWKEELAERYADQPEYRDILQYTYEVEGKVAPGAQPLAQSTMKADDAGQESTPAEQKGWKGDALSYMVTTSCYLGGAHGSYVVSYYNFDVKTGKLLKIEDIVPAGKEQDVLKAMAEQLCKDWEAKDLTDLQEKTGITMLGDLYLTNNFLLKGDSIEFLFNQYEIAPYAAGLIGVTLPRP